jgi:hypothetical protein
VIGLDDPRVTVREVVTTTAAEDCESCGARFAGINGVHWDAQDEPFGLLNVCDEVSCVRFAVRTALDDAPADSTVVVERSVYPYAMEAAA